MRIQPRFPEAVSGSCAADLSSRLRAVRNATTALALPLSAEDCTVQSMPDASPVKWHLAHTTWFFENFVLVPHWPTYRLFDQSYGFLFNSYYNAVGDRLARPQRGLLTRPSLERILAYRTHVDEALQAMFSADGAFGPLAHLLHLGLQHEQQHQELILTDIKHLLSTNPLQPAYQNKWPLTPVHTSDRGWVEVDGGLYSIGHDDAEGFCFDNELPQHRTWIEPFLIATHPVTHGDFIAFIEDGGYARPELWLSAGWDAVCNQGWDAPGYWQRRDRNWSSFTLHGRVPIDPQTPVCHLSFWEAEAYARWADARLPTEFEWEIAARNASGDGNFVESGALHPLALRERPAAGSLAQMFGDVWEWTRSDYAPYPGYRAAAGAIGEYNGKFMGGQYVLRGGSCVTPASHIRTSYRNFFPAQARWQFSGMRLARHCD